MAKILVIEDEDQSRHLFREILEREGYEVIEARDGEEGMSLMRVAPIDLIVTDILMPGTDGLECIMVLQKEFPRVKIIAISGGITNNNLDLLLLAKKLGASRTIAKPFELTTLIHAVKEELNSKVGLCFDE